MMKKSLQVITSVGLVSAMLLSGCASGNSNSGSTSESTLDSGSSQSGTDVALKDGEMTELRVVFPGATSSPASLEKVEEELNKVVAKYMDATVNLDIIEWGVYSDQQNLILSSGEDAALMLSFSSSRNFVASKQVQDITELVDVYAADTKAAFDKYIEACEIDGKLYGLPTFHEYTKSAGLVARADICEELGITADDVKTWSDIGAVLAKVKKAKPDMDMLCPVESGTGILDYYNEGVYDIFTKGVAVKADDEEKKVVNYYASPEYREMADLAYEWNNKGYFVPDVTTLTNTRQEFISAGNTFGYIGQIHPGTITQELKNAGVEMVTFPVAPLTLTTSNTNFAQYMVPTACKTPEKAVKLLDIMMTDTDASNLLSYGVEGVDYVMKDEADDIVGYPDGIDNSNVGWLNETWLVGNGSLAHVWESDPADIWDQYEEMNSSAIPSTAYGFTYSTEAVKTEITAIENVIKKYEATISAGYANPDESIATMVSELEASGINKVIEDAQSQLDAWSSER